MVSPMNMVAELEYECVDKDEEKCQDCRDRFKCWTSRDLYLPLSHVTLRKDITGVDEIEFRAELPRCFRCGNMVGSKVTVRAIEDDVMQVFNGLIIAHFIRAEGTAPMEIEVKGVRKLF